MAAPLTGKHPEGQCGYHTEDMRVVSLLASGTEIVCALGLGETLVGRSHECDNPAWVRSLPSCSEPAFDVTVSSREIDAEVNRRIRSGEPLYTLNSALIRELAPDVLITQEHCQVCAVTPGDVERGGCDSGAVSVIALSAGTLDGIYAGIMSVARALGVEAGGAALVQREQQRLATLTASLRTRRRPTLVMLEWIDPLFAMGNWSPELVEIAHAELLIGGKGQHSKIISFDEVVAADPEFLIVAPCGFGLERALAERAVLEALPGWRRLRARIAFADGNLFFNRSGMTVSRTAEIIAEIVHGLQPRGDEWCWA